MIGRPKRIVSKGVKSSKRANLPRSRISKAKVPKGLPSWIKAIPEGAHGSGTLQKRLWRLTSDYVRIRDFLEFGTYIDSGEKILDWNDAQAGHWRSYSQCHGMYKFNIDNIHAQTPKGNSWPTGTTWDNYRRNLIKRYGEEYVEYIDRINRPEHWRVPITKDMVLRDIESKIGAISFLRIKPPYYKRMIELRP